MRGVQERTFALPRDLVRVRTDVPPILELAARLWESPPSGAAAPLDGGIVIDIRARANGSLARPGPPVPEWTISPDDRRFEVALGAALFARFDLGTRFVAATVDPDLPGAEPALSARLLLEAPVAMLLSQRGHQMLHAGAILPPGGAVVLRGPSGAGKSTLVAAAWKAGLGVLGDESLLVSRDDPDALSASVRELTVLPATASLLGLFPDGKLDESGREPKLRIELFPGDGVAVRTARRVATVLLGPRDPGPARLTRLGPEDFLREFAKGEIPQERMGVGDPGPVAAAWARSGGWLLTGASDLSSALALLSDLPRDVGGGGGR